MIVPPAFTEAEEPLLEMATSDCAVTVVLAVEVPFAITGSMVADDVVAVFEMIEAHVASGQMPTVEVNAAVSPTATDAFVQLIVPPEPTAGVVQLQPAVAASETNRVCAGSVSVTTALLAA